MLVATTNDLAGYRITAHIGMVRGVTVRSRSVIGNVGGA
ncbi:MAG TPA: heavy metal-binding domain-containing protein, partial [Phenylobacterium sp.]|nr:heavy metal-binding domain-containing protein [Phenylobacterium sp.]